MEAALGDGIGEPCMDSEASGFLALELGAPAHAVTAAAGLGDAQGLQRRPLQRAGVGVGRVQRNFGGTGGAPVVRTFDLERCGQYAGGPVEIDQGRRADDAEQVVGDAGNHGGRREGRFQAPGDRRQQGIAKAVAETVRLARELVDVEQHQPADLAVRATQAIDFAEQGGGIRHAQHRVLEGEAIQPIDQGHVAEAARQVGGEDAQQLLFGRLEGATGPQIDDVVGSGLFARQEYCLPLCGVDRNVAGQRLPDGLFDRMVVECRQRSPVHIGVAALGTGDDRLPGVQVRERVGLSRHPRALADQTGHRNVEQSRGFGECLAREFVDRARCRQPAAGFDDQLQALARRDQVVQLAVGADGTGQHLVETASCKIRLDAVVGQVVVFHHAGDRCESGLSGEQDDARLHQPECLAHALGQPEAGVLAFHHDVDQNHREIPVLGELSGGLCEAVGLNDFEPAAEDDRVLQRKCGGALETPVVVDREDPPHAAAAGVMFVVLGNEHDFRIGVLCRFGKVQASLGHCLDAVCEAGRRRCFANSVDRFTAVPAGS